MRLHLEKQSRLTMIAKERKRLPSRLSGLQVVEDEFVRRDFSY
jgi:hypothetical protein